jgi:hypothetical protein
VRNESYVMLCLVAGAINRAVTIEGHRKTQMERLSELHLDLKVGLQSMKSPWLPLDAR